MAPTYRFGCWQAARSLLLVAMLLDAAAGLLCFGEFWIALHPPKWWALEGFSPEDWHKPQDMLFPAWLVTGLPVLLACGVFRVRAARLLRKHDSAAPLRTRAA